MVLIAGVAHLQYYNQVKKLSLFNGRTGTVARGF